GWGSFQNWENPTPPWWPLGFHIVIWEDVPKNPDDYTSFSHPGKAVWEYYSYDYQWNFAGFDKDPRVFNGTGDPTTDMFQPTIHDSCFQFYCDIPLDQWFYQKPSACGTNVYWISISAIYTPSGGPDSPFFRIPGVGKPARNISMTMRYGFMIWWM
ncbi:MAG: hypothetical protein GY869_32320, partial [Planctomycetes bacterium]|nr:hypothetical protein [Planctomycetota bacterium]